MADECRVTGQEHKGASDLRLRVLLAFWLCLGLAGCAEVVYFGLRDDVGGFLLGLTFALAAIWMLGSGLWMRWPRG